MRNNKQAHRKKTNLAPLQQIDSLSKKKPGRTKLTSFTRLMDKHNIENQDCNPSSKLNPPRLHSQTVYGRPESTKLKTLPLVPDVV